RLLSADGQAQLVSGEQWLLANANVSRLYEELWLNKVIYSPGRIDHTYHLSVLLAAAEHHSAQPFTRAREWAVQQQAPVLDG
ncbi:MAG TPA: hypothetical protein VNK95_19215, partial [Caldilineaceae bacterium]|nr:hypothetical protein [Caldilineaceae bacterium]